MLVGDNMGKRKEIMKNRIKTLCFFLRYRHPDYIRKAVALKAKKAQENKGTEVIKNKTASESLKELIEKNIEISNEILEIARYTKGFIYWKKIISFVQILVIVVPIILALIYVPPFLRGLMETIDKMTGVSNFL
jgi:hypothetical protein